MLSFPANFRLALSVSLSTYPLIQSRLPTRSSVE
jgi:hypothetical protein